MSALSDARAYVGEQLGIDMKGIQDMTVMRYVDRHFPGGWTAWKDSHPDESATVAESVPVIDTTPTMLQLRAKVERMVGRQIRLHVMDEIVKVVIKDKMIMVRVKCYDTTVLSRRVKVNRTGTKMLFWELTQSGWVADDPSVSWDETVDEADQHLWGTINTPERLQDKLDQASLCWRPGTPQSPVDAWTVRDKADEEWIDTFGIGVTYKRD